MMHRAVGWWLRQGGLEAGRHVVAAIVLYLRWQAHGGSMTARPTDRDNAAILSGIRSDGDRPRPCRECTIGPVVHGLGGLRQGRRPRGQTWSADRARGPGWDPEADPRHARSRGSDHFRCHPRSRADACWVARDHPAVTSGRTLRKAGPPVGDGPRRRDHRGLRSRRRVVALRLGAIGDGCGGRLVQRTGQRVSLAGRRPGTSLPAVGPRSPARRSRVPSSLSALRRLLPSPLRATSANPRDRRCPCRRGEYAYHRIHPRGGSRIGVVAANRADTVSRRARSGPGRRSRGLRGRR